MSKWLPGWVVDVAVSWAAWTQERYFEPEHYSAPWLVYSREGSIELRTDPPRPHPSLAVWRRVSDTETYERVDCFVRTHEIPTLLPTPIVQAVVRQQSRAPRQRRSRGKPRDYDITAELSQFGGFPQLDWMHVGACVKHRYDVVLLPGQYTLSIIDGDLNLHELDADEAAVFSVSGNSTPSGLGFGIEPPTEPHVPSACSPPADPLAGPLATPQAPSPSMPQAPSPSMPPAPSPSMPRTPSPSMPPAPSVQSPDHDPEQDPEPDYDGDDEDDDDLSSAGHSSPEPEFEEDDETDGSRDN